VGLKGAAFSANPDDASTAGTSKASDEERSESWELRTLGLSGWYSSSLRTCEQTLLVRKYTD
jgi:hypothetical protein